MKTKLKPQTNTEVMKQKLKIRVAQNDRVLELSNYINKLLKLIGHPEALVTDESILWDFKSFNPIKAQKDIEKLSNKLGFKVNLKSKLIEIAEELKRKEEIKK